MLDSVGLIPDCHIAFNEFGFGVRQNCLLGLMMKKDSPRTEKRFEVGSPTLRNNGCEGS